MADLVKGAVHIMLRRRIDCPRANVDAQVSQSKSVSLPCVLDKWTCIFLDINTLEYVLLRIKFVLE